MFSPHIVCLLVWNPVRWKHYWKVSRFIPASAVILLNTLRNKHRYSGWLCFGPSHPFVNTKHCGANAMTFGKTGANTWRCVGICVSAQYWAIWSVQPRDILLIYSLTRIHILVFAGLCLQRLCASLRKDRPVGECICAKPISLWWVGESIEYCRRSMLFFSSGSMAYETQDIKEHAAGHDRIGGEFENTFIG